MIFNFFSIIVMLLLFWSLGRIIVHFIQYDEKFECLYMVIGSSAVAFFTTLLYFRANFSISVIKIIWILIFLICIFVQIFMRMKVLKSELYGILFTFFIILIVAIPGIIHGDQYYVYRGNVWDQNIYLSESFLASRYKWTDVLSSNGNLPNDVYKFGYNILTTDRPSVALVCALLYKPETGNIFFTAFLYHCMFIAMVFCPLCSFSGYIIRTMTKNIQNKTNYIISCIIALFYVIGFWGQIQFDINAWSHICSIALFISYMYLILLLFEDVVNNRKKYICDFNIWIFLTIVSLGGFMYYVENWLIQYVISCMTVLLMCIACRYKPRLSQVGVMLSFAATSFFMAYISCPQIIDFLIGQLYGAVGGTVDYGAYWRNWLSGFWIKDGIADSAKLPSFLLSSFGMSHYVPFWGKNTYLVYGWLLFMFVASVLLICNIFFRIYRLFVADAIAEKFIAVIFICSTITGIFLYIKSREYGFVKYIMYISPYTWCLACISIIYGINRKKLIDVKNIVWLSALSVLLSGFVFFAFRCYDTVYNDKANGYSYLSYPADQDPQLKDTHVFNFDAEKLGGADVVELEAEFPFYLYYMKLSTLYAGKEYYCAENHVLYSTEDELMEKPDKIDAKVSLKKNADNRLEPIYEY